MNQICPVKITCEPVFPGTDIDSPITNITAETPDQLIFVGIGYNPFPPYAPPRLGPSYFIAYDCFGRSFSVESQEIADLIAQFNAEWCEQDGIVPIPPGTDPQQYANSPQTATVYCPDGTAFSYTVQAGMFVATFSNPEDAVAWLTAANAVALAYAEQQASAQKICINPPVHGNPNLHATGKWMCLGEELDPTYNTYNLTGPNASANYNFTVTGDLPPGTTFRQIDNNSAVLEGTPTVAGMYSWTVRAARVDMPWVYAEVEDELRVLGFNNRDLPYACVGESYSHDLQADGGITIVCDVIGGALPPGLTLSSEGVISGTPTTPGNWSFRIRITDELINSCNELFTIPVPGLTTTTLPNGITSEEGAGAFYFQQLLADGGTPPRTFALQSGNLPPGLTLSSSGLISGTPTDDGTYSFSVEVTDAEGRHCASPLSITVDPACCHPPINIMIHEEDPTNINENFIASLTIGQGVITAYTTTPPNPSGSIRSRLRSPERCDGAVPPQDGFIHPVLCPVSTNWTFHMQFDYSFQRADILSGDTGLIQVQFLGGGFAIPFPAPGSGSQTINQPVNAGFDSLDITVLCVATKGGGPAGSTMGCAYSYWWTRP